MIRKEERLSFTKPKTKKRKEEDAPRDRVTYVIAPTNLSYLGPRDTGCRPIYQSEALTVLCLFIHLIVLVGIKLLRF